MFETVKIVFTIIASALLGAVGLGLMTSAVLEWVVRYMRKENGK